jgi:hypothetical protein
MVEPPRFRQEYDPEAFSAGYWQRVDEERRAVTPLDGQRPSRLRRKRRPPAVPRAIPAGIDAVNETRRNAVASGDPTAHRAFDNTCAEILADWWFAFRWPDPPPPQGQRAPLGPAYAGVPLGPSLAIGVLVELDNQPRGTDWSDGLLAIYAPTRRQALRRRRQEVRVGLKIPEPLEAMLRVLAVHPRWRCRIRRCMACSPVRAMLGPVRNPGTAFG